jgi:uncharacterized protein (DUF1697 family)
MNTFRQAPGAIAWRIARANQSRSRVPKIVGTPMHRRLTARNPNTVRALLDLMVEGADPPPRDASR